MKIVTWPFLLKSNLIPIILNILHDFIDENMSELIDSLTPGRFVWNSKFIFLPIDIISVSFKIALRWMLQDSNGDESNIGSGNGLGFRCQAITRTNDRLWVMTSAAANQ